MFGLDIHASTTRGKHLNHSLILLSNLWQKLGATLEDKQHFEMLRRSPL